jgi:hypothetical protein
MGTSGIEDTFPAKAWFRPTPWDPLINTVLRRERTVHKHVPQTAPTTNKNACYRAALDVKAAIKFSTH